MITTLQNKSFDILENSKTVSYGILLVQDSEDEYPNPVLCTLDTIDSGSSEPNTYVTHTKDKNKALRSLRELRRLFPNNIYILISYKALKS